MPEPKEIGHQVRFEPGLLGLFRKACWHLPEHVGGTLVMLVGIGMACKGVINYYKMDGDNREYKSTYVILREGDPRADRIINPSRTEYVLPPPEIDATAAERVKLDYCQAREHRQGKEVIFYDGKKYLPRAGEEERQRKKTKLEEIKKQC